MVADRLADTWEVTRQIRNDTRSEREPGELDISAGSIIKAALNNDFRIVHLAGHGVYDPSGPLRSGMVLGGNPGSPDRVLFTPAEVRQMRLTPDLVFINCCHLGRVAPTKPHLLAANLATEFIRAGVRAVIAAGWAVDDEAAMTFASTFYDEILRGTTFGEAVRQARFRTYKGHPHANTWGAYQCYGDPGFRLLMDPEVRRRVSTGGYDYFDPGEVEMELDNLVSSLLASDKHKSAAATAVGPRTKLDALKNTARARGWDADCGVALGIARVHGELGEFAEADQWFEKALREDDDGRVTLKDLEQKANFLARRGGNLLDSANKEREKVVSAALGAKRQATELRRVDNRAAEGETLVRRAFDEISRLLEHGATAERLSIHASAGKRLLAREPGGTAASRKRVVNYLWEMTESYMRAAEMRADDWYYPATNAFAGILLLGGPWKSPRRRGMGAGSYAGQRRFTDTLVESRQYVDHLQPKSFWDAVCDPDLAVVESLARGTLKADAKAIGDTYVALFKKLGSARELDSVVNQLEFVEETIGKTAHNECGMPGKAAPRKEVLAGIAAVLKRVREGLPKEA